MPVNKQKKQAMDGLATPFFRLYQGQPALNLGCILAGFLLLNPALAQEAPGPELPGPDVAEQIEGADYEFSHNPANEYLDAIENVEADYGPYATELTDLYLGLGQALLENGDFEQAREAFHRSVLVVRVNSGPNSPEQTNHLYRLANIATTLGESRAANAVLQNIYFVNSSYYGEDSPEMLPVLERMYQWYLVARPPGSLSLRYDDYDRVLEITEEMVRISELERGINHPETAVAYRCYAEAQFQMVRHQTGSGMKLTPESYSILTTGNAIPLTLDSDAVYKHYKKGLRAFDSYLESILAKESTTPLEHAEALADLGDWFLLFDKPARSRKLYEQGYQILRESEQYADMADSYMSQPKPAHFIINPLPDLLENAMMEFRGMSLDISITVTSFGNVHSIEVLEAPEGITKNDLRDIKMQMRAIPFRPAMKEGEVVTTKDFIWHYSIDPGENAS